MCVTLELFAGLAIDIAVNSKAFKFDEIVELYQNRTWRGWFVLASLVLIIILMTALPAVLSHKVFSKYECQRECLFLAKDFIKNNNIEDTRELYGKLITDDNNFSITNENSMLTTIEDIDTDDLDPFEAYNQINDLLWEKGKCHSITENDTSINNDILNDLIVQNKETNRVLNFLGFGKKTLAIQTAAS